MGLSKNGPPNSCEASGAREPPGRARAGCLQRCWDAQCNGGFALMFYAWNDMLIIGPSIYQCNLLIND